MLFQAVIQSVASVASWEGYGSRDQVREQEGIREFEICKLIWKHLEVVIKSAASAALLPAWDLHGSARRKGDRDGRTTDWIGRREADLAADLVTAPRSLPEGLR